MKITKGKVVDMQYSLKNDSGEVLDQAPDGQPLSYLHGFGNIVPGLEKALDGLSKGDKKAVKVSPEEGYGKFNGDLKVAVPRSQFPKDVEIEAGMRFQAHSPDGHPVVYTVDSVVGDKVNLDGNHPLAGQTLHFEVEVVGVREASKEELTHGHVHGPGGHHH